MNRKSLIYVAFLGVLALSSCKKDETQAVLNPSAGAFVAPANGTEWVLTKETRNDTKEFTWASFSFGFQSSVDYTVQIAKSGTDFADPLPLGTVNNEVSLDVVIEDLNNVVKNFLEDPEVPAPTSVDIRVKAVVSSNVDPEYSNLVTITVTPFVSPIVYPLISVPGSYQGWNPADSNFTIGSVRSDGKYEGYMWFADAAVEFKYTTSFSWDVNYGDTGADGILDPGGDNIIAGDAGLYKLNVDMNALTHTFAKTDWGLIGSATPGGWDSDQDMTYDVDNKVLVVTVDLVAGEIKFRANDAWDINLGDDDANGKLEYGGANIAIAEAGNYTITLNLSKPVYTYTVVKN